MDLAYIENSSVSKRAKIYPFVTIIDSTIEDDAVILPYSYIKNSCIKAGAEVFASTIEDSVVEKYAKVGPMAHLRPNSIVEENCKIGNFVEIKNSTVSAGSKISHLSYVGDAFVGKNVNIGCGVVFVNYNGKVKQKSRVEEGSFIGSSVNLIAPVKVGKGAYVCAGTTVDHDVEDNAFVIGRSKMSVKPNRAKKYLGE